jgi:hypothetical protein
MFDNKKIEKVEKISTDAFGNSKYRVTERTGWFSTKTYEVEEKSNTNEANAGLLILGIIFLIAIFAILVLPYILVLAANSPSQMAKQSKFRWIAFISLVLFTSGFIFVLKQPNTFEQFSDIIQNPWILSIFFGLNTTALASLVLARFSFITNKANQYFCIIGGISAILFAFQLILSSNSQLVSFKYNDEQMNAACECYQNSFSHKHQSFDFMSADEQSKRKSCFELFKPSGYKLGDDVDIIMKEACELKNSNHE